MNLFSCEKCGVVLDKTRIDIPYQIDEEKCEYILDNCYWDGDKHCPAIICPICKSKISYKNGDVV